jgi:proteic killer suppression protein
MIRSIGNRLAQNLYNDIKSKEVVKFPPELRLIARRKLLYLHDAEELKDLRVPPGNKLERLKGKRKGFYSIRINDQWRLIFKWDKNSAFEVQITDYH